MGETTRLFYVISAIVLLGLGLYIAAVGATGIPKDFLTYWGFDIAIIAFGFSFIPLYSTDLDAEKQRAEIQRLSNEVKKLRELIEKRLSENQVRQD